MGHYLRAQHSAANQSDQTYAWNTEVRVNITSCSLPCPRRLPTYTRFRIVEPVFSTGGTDFIVLTHFRNTDPYHPPLVLRQSQQCRVPSNNESPLVLLPLSPNTKDHGSTIHLLRDPSVADTLEKIEHVNGLAQLCFFPAVLYTSTSSNDSYLDSGERCHIGSSNRVAISSPTAPTRLHAYSPRAILPQR
jgi:hypothetical protein